ncbi:fimbrial biogenesis outer membrane usher protein [Vibrio parahaemolyticus]|uniref:fimbria/pilus outer membrane usher protein n=2 Tax=Vibrio parahaemolyticus TaxID=670 RepID=UPI00046E5DE4|nr:fimbria/pilus outer membrane usher protein [Vibrio parahaemolyticus]MBE4469300.1 fimbrial biogenesis outer membrane usher protein [Vibrio parahaemolyticus]TNY77292.1 fimbrial biogenesis outer membrane usher protein [Vibrio parahaemolyticus]
MFKMTRIAMSVAICCYSLSSYAEVGGFNLGALELNDTVTSAENLELFLNTDSGMLPGTYNVDLYVNNHYVSTTDIEFESIKGSKELRPAISKQSIRNFGVKVDDITSTKKIKDDEVVTDWENYIPNFIYKFNSKKQRLDIYVPQIYMDREQQGWVNPESWDDGITAFMLNYNLQGINGWYDGESANNSYYANLRTGFNYKGWRIRNYSTYNYDATNDTEDWNNLGTKIFHDIKSINSRFEAGNISTRSSIFDSVQVVGAQLVSEDSMLPDSQRGFAPVIHGIANSNAKVTVEQDGSVIYQTVVSPGQFIIDDLYPTSLSGDLVVTIREEDGSERTFIQPFSSVPNMVREDQFKYTVSAGQYDSSSIDSDAMVAEASAMYGISNALTVYGGAQTSEDYRSFALGVGVSLGRFGALTGDVIHSIADVEGQGYTQGQSYSINYSKDIEEIGASFNLASYRYSTEDYYSLEDLLIENEQGSGFWWGFDQHKKQKFQISFNQQINDGEWGSLSVYGYQQEYWNSENIDRNLTASYSNNIDRVSYSLSYSMMDSTMYTNDSQVMLNVSLPLDGWFDSGYVDYSISNDRNNHTIQRAAYTNTALEDNSLSYSVVATAEDGEANDSISASTSYTGSNADLNATVSRRKNSTQLSYGASGAVIVHSGGVTMSQPINSADYNGVVLVDTNDAEDVHIENGTGIDTNGSGYAVVPYVNSYEANEVAIDSDSLGQNMEATNTITKVVPTAGAIVKAKFNIKEGYKALLTIKHKGQFVPFGSIVKMPGDINNDISYIGNDGVAYLSGLEKQGELHVLWGKKMCNINYDLTKEVESSSQSALIKKTVECQ